MKDEVINRILKRIGYDDLIQILTKEISFSELNSLLLEVFKKRVEVMTPAELLKKYKSNRFVKPSEGDPIKLRQLELDILKICTAFSFIPVELSPVAPIGACSVIATVDQNKIISALRGAEVVADATNSLAIHICHLKRNMKQKKINGADTKMKYCTLHRHVRAQKYSNARSMPHFKLLCIVTSGLDMGSYFFEKENLLEHLNIYKTIFEQLVHIRDLKYNIIRVGGYTDSNGFIKAITEYICRNFDGNVNILEEPSKFNNQYYKGLQFKLYVNFEGREYEVADGGFVNWSQKLMENRKERMIISGLGVERVLSIWHSASKYTDL